MKLIENRIWSPFKLITLFINKIYTQHRQQIYLNINIVFKSLTPWLLNIAITKIMFTYSTQGKLR